METQPVNVLEALDRLDGTLHVCDGRLTGHLRERHSGASIRFRGRDEEAIFATLDRAIVALRRRILEGMPQTTRRGSCAGCGTARVLRRLRSEWLCDECRHGARQMQDEERRARRRRARSGV